MQNFFKCCLSYNPLPNSEQKIPQLKLSKILPTKLVSNSSILNTPVINTHKMNFGNSSKRKINNLDLKNDTFITEEVKKKEEPKDSTAGGTESKKDINHSGYTEQKPNSDKKINKNINKNNEAFDNIALIESSSKIPKIELNVIDSKNPQNEKKYIITNEGQITTQLYFKKTNITYIGAETNNKASPSYISLPNQQRLSHNHFYIKFDNKIQKYFLKDNSSEGGTFVKLQGAMTITNSVFIAFGEIQISIKIMENKDLSFHILEEEDEGKGVNFSMNDSPINIGRSDKCKLYIKSSALSRNQCYFEFKNNEWWIFDGSADGNPSTNGTWIFALNDIEIIDNLRIKAAETIFRVSFIN